MCTHGTLGPAYQCGYPLRFFLNTPIAVHYSVTTHEVLFHSVTIVILCVCDAGGNKYLFITVKYKHV